MDEMSLGLVILEKTELFPNNSLDIWKEYFKGTTKAETHLYQVLYQLTEGAKWKHRDMEEVMAQPRQEMMKSQRKNKETGDVRVRRYLRSQVSQT